MIPGQLGPISLVLLCLTSLCFTWGQPDKNMAHCGRRGVSGGEKGGEKGGVKGGVEGELGGS